MTKSTESSPSSSLTRSSNNTGGSPINVRSILPRIMDTHPHLLDAAATATVTAFQAGHPIVDHESLLRLNGHPFLLSRSHCGSETGSSATLSTIAKILDDVFAILDDGENELFALVSSHSPNTRK